MGLLIRWHSCRGNGYADSSDRLAYSCNFDATFMDTENVKSMVGQSSDAGSGPKSVLSTGGFPGPVRPLQTARPSMS
jgi:hypothetical protein